MEQHCDTGALALGALGEALESDADAHLRQCGRCQHELARMTATVSVARSTLGEAELHRPPAHVWQNVHRQAGLGDAVRTDPLTTEGADQRAARETAPMPVDELPPAAPVASLAAARERRGLRRIVAPLTAVAAAAALIAGVAFGWQALAPRDTGTILAVAALDALPDWQGASGSAEIVERGDGARVVRIALDAPPVSGAVQEVWLLTPEVDGLISLGLLGDARGEFVIPAEVDLDRYSVVDISAEPLDGDPSHSGDSIVRGALES
ncbi:anti-sigma factor [Microcella sp.]|uniref:anti-sigma factor n=1 Tax=Microcella sp. TaxID=1913979 RepID=UPI0039191F98